LLKSRHSLYWIALIFLRNLALIKLRAMQRGLYYAINLLLIMACSSPGEESENVTETKPDFETIEKEIGTLIIGYNTVFADGNVDSLLSFYEDDALRVPPDEALNRGISEIIQVIEEFNAENNYILIETGEIEFRTTENMVVAYSTFVDYWVSKSGGGTTKRDGRWITVWRRQDDGSWKISMEIWNKE